MSTTDNTAALDNLRKLAIISLFSDDDLMELFVLKGGNALNIAYGVNDRASMDLDFSIRQDFGEDYDIIVEKITNALERTFGDEDFHAFDIKFFPTPETVSEQYQSFWGGYTLEFKVITRQQFQQLGGDIESIRRHAMVIDDKQGKRMKIDISKYEYTDPKGEVDLEGYTVYVYTPLMVVYEKLRALCQQLEYYSTHVVPTHRRQRARDFFDIHSILTKFPTLDPLNINDLNILIEIFKIKKVPLSLLDKLEENREYHRESFYGVTEHVSPEYHLESYDFYFNYVLNLASGIINVLKAADLYRDDAVKSSH